jgi:IS66 C-terminal element
MDDTGSGLPTPARHGQNERAIAITRKNALFAGSDGGGRTWATIATLLQTAKMNDVDPLTWLAQTLQRIANGWPISQIEKLMPWNYKPERPRLGAYSARRPRRGRFCAAWPHAKAAKVTLDGRAAAFCREVRCVERCSNAVPLLVWIHCLNWAAGALPVYRANDPRRPLCVTGGDALQASVAVLSS